MYANENSIKKTPQFPTPETIREMATSSRCNDFWDRLVGQAVLVIG